MITKFIC